MKKNGINGILTMIILILVCIALIIGLFFVINNYVMPLLKKEPVAISFTDNTKGVLATVNGTEVYGYLYDYYKLYTLSYYASYGMPLGEDSYAMVEQDAFERTLGDTLLREVARDYGVTITDEEIDAVLADEIENGFGGREEYEEQLELFGITDKHFRELITTSLYDEAVYNKIIDTFLPPEEEIQTLFKATPVTRKTSHILVLFKNAAGEQVTEPTEAEKKAAYDEAVRIIALIDATPDKFAELAIEHSDDGSAPYGGVINVLFNKNSLTLYSEYIAGAFELEKVGDYSRKPVESSAGYHIIRIDEEMTDLESFIETLRNEVPADDCNAVYSAAIEEKFETADVHIKKKFSYWTEGNETYK